MGVLALTSVRWGSGSKWTQVLHISLAFIKISSHLPVDLWSTVFGFNLFSLYSLWTVYSVTDWKQWATPTEPSTLWKTSEVIHCSLPVFDRVLKINVDVLVCWNISKTFMAGGDHGVNKLLTSNESHQFIGVSKRVILFKRYCFVYYRQILWPIFIQSNILKSSTSSLWS